METVPIDSLGFTLVVKVLHKRDILKILRY